MLVIVASAAAAVVWSLSKLLRLKHVWPGVVIAFIVVMIVGWLA